MENNESKYLKITNDYFAIAISRKHFWIFFEFETKIRDFIFNYTEPFPSYIQQGVCDPLPENRGIYFFEHVVKSIPNEELYSDFNSCFVYNFDLNDEPNENHLKQNFTFEFDLDDVSINKDKIHIKSLELSTKINNLNSDFFYLKNQNVVILATKDIAQLRMWKNLLIKNVQKK